MKNPFAVVVFRQGSGIQQEGSEFGEQTHQRRRTRPTVHPNQKRCVRVGVLHVVVECSGGGDGGLGVEVATVMGGIGVAQIW